MSRNIKLTIMYDGSNYNGWQKQINLPTIQETIEEAIYKVTGERVNLTGSGRTDSGVHAIGQVANFKTSSQIPNKNLIRALNSNMSTDIRVIEAEDVDEDFSARFTSKRKTYMYQIYNDRISNPFYDKYAYFIPYTIDIDLMKEAANQLVGEHDFAAFMASKSEVKTTVRTIYDIKVNKEGKLITVEVTGSGFLYNMMRIIVGTLIEIGTKRKPVNCFQIAYENKQRQTLGKTAEAKGLFLKKVNY